MNQILDRISKALELGNNNTNENEAQSAILAVQRLMAKYHISQEDIDDFVNEKEEKEAKETEVIEEKADNETNNDKWKRRLMIVIAENFRCDVYYKGKKLVIVGASEDILISKRVYLYAKQAILNNFKRIFKENYQYCSIDASTRNKYKRDYAYGFVKGLNEKFKEQKANSELAMVVVNPKVDEYLKNISFSGVFHSRPSQISSGFCFEQGRIHGKNLADIDTSIEEIA